MSKPRSKSPGGQPGGRRREGASNTSPSGKKPRLRAIPAPPPTGSYVDLPLDRVTGRLFLLGALDADRLRAVEPTWNAAVADGSHEPFWRFLARQEGIDADLVYRTAAALYGFQPASVDEAATLSGMARLQRTWPRDSFARLAALGAVPVASASVASWTATGPRPVIASHDPARPELRTLLDGLVKGPYDLRFLPRVEVDRCIAALGRRIPGLFPAGVVRLAESTEDRTMRRAA